METNPDNPDLEEPVATPKKATRTPAQKAARKRRDAAAKKHPDKTIPTATELAAEVKENLRETKDQFVEATVEPAKKVIATWTAFAEIGKELAVGIWDGFLGTKKRKD